MTQMPADPKASVNGPAIGLMVTAGLGAAVQVVSILLNLLGVGLGAAAGAQQGAMNMLGGGIGLVFNVIAIIMAVVVFMGASKLKNLQGYGFAMTGAIIAMVPCVSPCCLLGLPFGIWALVVMMKPEVKSAFTS